MIPIRWRLYQAAMYKSSCLIYIVLLHCSSVQGLYDYVQSPYAF